MNPDCPKMTYYPSENKAKGIVTIQACHLEMDISARTCAKYSNRHNGNHRPAEWCNRPPPTKYVEGQPCARQGCPKKWSKGVKGWGKGLCSTHFAAQRRAAAPAKPTKTVRPKEGQLCAGDCCTKRWSKGITKGWVRSVCHNCRLRQEYWGKRDPTKPQRIWKNVEGTQCAGHNCTKKFSKAEKGWCKGMCSSCYQMSRRRKK